MLRGELLIALYVLARLGAHRGSVVVSTAELAARLGVSQQTASRRLQELEAKGLIERVPGPRGTRVRLTEQGLNELRALYLGLRDIFETPSEGVLRIRGRVVSGLGEGAFYVTIPRYHAIFTRLLGAPPYPGTLNLRLVDEASLEARRKLEGLPGITIPGFSDGRRSYGGVRCFHARIAGRPALLLLIERTHHPPEIIELISPVCLRKELKLRDGDLVEVEVLPP